MTEHQIVSTSEQDRTLAPLAASVRTYLEASMSQNTMRGYSSDWRTFTIWCDEHGIKKLPAAPTTVATYLSHLADNGKKASTIDRARASIRKAHETAGYDDPTHTLIVTQTLRGIRRTLGIAPTQKAPALTPDIKAMVSALPSSRKGLRDKTILLLGFAGGFRRSELIGIRVEDITVSDEGIIINLPKSKTDQEGKGRLVGILRGSDPNTCPIRAMQSWLLEAGISSGPVFRHINKGGRIHSQLTSQSVAAIIKEAAKAACLDPMLYSGHSLRSGFVSQCAKNKVAVTSIMQQTGHKSVQTVHRYIRRVNIFEDNASGMVGL